MLRTLIYTFSAKLGKVALPGPVFPPGGLARELSCSYVLWKEPFTGPVTLDSVTDHEAVTVDGEVRVSSHQAPFTHARPCLGPVAWDVLVTLCPFKVSLLVLAISGFLFFTLAPPPGKNAALSLLYQLTRSAAPTYRKSGTDSFLQLVNLKSESRKHIWIIKVRHLQLP